MPNHGHIYYMYVYKTTNLINGKIYIGKSTRTDEYWIENYMGSGVYIQKAFKKYGKENFKKEILEWTDTEEALALLERQYIRSYNSTKPVIGYNASEDSSKSISGTVWYHNPETNETIRTKTSMPSPWVKGRSRNIKAYKHICKECGTEFQTRRVNSQYCSASCSSLNKPSQLRPRYTTPCKHIECNNPVENWEGTKRPKQFCSKW